MNYLYITIAILMSSLVLSGCAGVAPDSMKPVAVIKKFDLERQYSYTINALLGSAQVTYAAGTYTSIKEDRDGVYYVGSPQCFSAQGSIIGTRLRTDDCGIFIPHRKDGIPTVFTVVGTTVYHKEGEVVQRAAAVVPISVVTSTPMTPMQAGAAGGIAGGMVGLLLEAEKGRYVFLGSQPKEDFRTMVPISWH